MRYFLLSYLAVYIAAAFAWRSYSVRKRTGINPVVFKASDDAHGLIGKIFKLTFAFVVLIVLVYSFFPFTYQFTTPISWLERPAVRWVGVALLILSLVWTVIAQYQMGESWRIGIDEEHRSPLVNKGVFRYSRNPIFVGIMITLLGLFFVIPNAVTLVILVVGVVLIAIQVRLEEQYLLKAHGEKYADYQRRVRRWL